LGGIGDALGDIDRKKSYAGLRRETGDDLCMRGISENRLEVGKEPPAYVVPGQAPEGFATRKMRIQLP